MVVVSRLVASSGKSQEQDGDDERRQKRETRERGLSSRRRGEAKQAVSQMPAAGESACLPVSGVTGGSWHHGRRGRRASSGRIHQSERVNRPVGSQMWKEREAARARH